MEQPRTYRPRPQQPRGPAPNRRTFSDEAFPDHETFDRDIPPMTAAEWATLIGVGLLIGVLAIAILVLGGCKLIAL